MNKRLLGLAAVLLVAYFLVSQGVAASSHGVEPMVGACFLLPDAQEMSGCSSIQAQGSCNSSCVSSHVGNPATPELPLLSSSPSPDNYSSHAGRVLSGPEPFPPKFSAVS